MDRPRQQRGDRENRQIIPAFGVLWQGIGRDDLACTAGIEALAGRTREHTVGAGDDDVLGAGFLQHTNGACDGAAGVDHVVEKHTGVTRNVTNNAVGNDLVGDVDGTSLVNESEREIAEGVSPLLSGLHTAGIRGHNNGVSHVVVLLDVVGEDRHGVHVIHRAVEEALNLVGVEVDSNDAVGTCDLEEVGDEASGDGLAAAVLLVLASVGVEGHDRGDALCRATLQRIDHDELFHDVFVHGLRVGLDYECIRASDGFFEADEDLTVGEVTCGRGGELDTELLGHCFAEGGVAAARE